MEAAHKQTPQYKNWTSPVHARSRAALVPPRSRRDFFHRLMSPLTFSTRFLQPAAGAGCTAPELRKTSYLHSLDGEISAFIRSTKGRARLDEFRQHAQKLKLFMTEYDPAHALAANENFDRFLRRGEEGPTGFFSMELALLYGPGKQALDRLCSALDNAHLSLASRVTCVRELAANLSVCAPGCSTHLVLGGECLQAGQSVALHAKEIVRTQIDQVIALFARVRHGHETGYARNEIHYVKGYHNYIATWYGLSERQDNFVPATLARDIDDCLAEGGARVSEATVVHQMAEELLQELHAHLLHGPFSLTCRATHVGGSVLCCRRPLYNGILPCLVDR